MKNNFRRRVSCLLALRNVVETMKCVLFVAAPPPPKPAPSPRPVQVPSPRPVPAPVPRPMVASPRPPPEHKPLFQKQLTNQCLYLGGTAYFECKVDGYPPPEILWTRRGHPLVDKARSAVVTTLHLHSSVVTGMEADITPLFSSASLLCTARHCGTRCFCVVG